MKWRRLIRDKAGAPRARPEFFPLKSPPIPVILLFVPVISNSEVIYESFLFPPPEAINGIVV